MAHTIPHVSAAAHHHSQHLFPSLAALLPHPSICLPACLHSCHALRCISQREKTQRRSIVSQHMHARMQRTTSLLHSRLSINQGSACIVKEGTQLAHSMYGAAVQGRLHIRVSPIRCPSVGLSVCVAPLPCSPLPSSPGQSCSRYIVHRKHHYHSSRVVPVLGFLFLIDRRIPSDVGLCLCPPFCMDPRKASTARV